MKQTLSIRKYLLIGSLIFGMLFGAGNLIFPVHLGQMAGGPLVGGYWGLFVLRGVATADGAPGDFHYPG